MEHTWNQVWDTFKNVSWYKWTVFRNPGGDLVKWIEDDGNKSLCCKGLVRREDGLVFQGSLQCYECTGDEEERYPHRGHRIGYYFRGSGIFGSLKYDDFGSVLHRNKT
jgi:hypothetical protein